MDYCESEEISPRWVAQLRREGIDPNSLSPVEREHYLRAPWPEEVDDSEWQATWVERVPGVVEMSFKEVATEASGVAGPFGFQVGDGPEDIPWVETSMGPEDVEATMRRVLGDGYPEPKTFTSGALNRQGGLAAALLADRFKESFSVDEDVEVLGSVYTHGRWDRRPDHRPTDVDPDRSGNWTDKLRAIEEDIPWIETDEGYHADIKTFYNAKYPAHPTSVAQWEAFRAIQSRDELRGFLESKGCTLWGVTYNLCTEGDWGMDGAIDFIQNLFDKITEWSTRSDDWND